MSDLDRFEPRGDFGRAAREARATIANVFPRRRITRLPVGEQRTWPVQPVKDVLVYNMPRIRERLQPEHRARFETNERLIQRPYGDRATTVQYAVRRDNVRRCNNVNAAMLGELVDKGVMRVVTEEEEARRPTIGTVNCFPVVEEAKHRLRIVVHPEEQNNAAYEAGYKAVMPELQHIGGLRHVVHEEFAVLGDITASFYGYELDDEAAQCYRFRDAEGRLLEMRRGIMGHAVMAEIQHVITCVVVGHPQYVARQHVVIARATDVWIDNIRVAGPRNIVDAAREAVANNCRLLNVAMTPSDAQRQYEFIGAVWNHSKRTMRVGPKTLGKLPDSIDTTITAGDFEGLIGRLIYADGVRGTPLIYRYWTLKWARRRFNQLNRGIIDVDTPLAVPNGVRAALEHWLRSARLEAEVRPKAADDARTFTIFTDASQHGWGAVMVDSENRIFSAGAKFSEAEASGNINAKEAAAVRHAFAAFADTVPDAAVVNLLVDNTSVQANVTRMHAAADSMVDEIASIATTVMRRAFTLRVGYVNTAENPADSISRGRELTIDDERLARRSRPTI